MQIVSFKAENIKRLVAAEITPKGNVVEITGRNGQGKTSVLDAIQWALDINKVVQSKPVRDGAESGYIRLDLGEFIVTKKFRVKDDDDVAISLTVQNRDGAKYSSPTELLKGFLSAFTFDPLAFSYMKPREQVVALRALVPGYDFADADAANKRDYDDRTEVNRDALSLKKRIEAIEIPDDTPAERVSIDALMDEINSAMDHNSRVDQQQAELVRAQDKISQLDNNCIARAKQIAEAEKKLKELRKLNVQDAEAADQLRKQIEGIQVEEKLDTDPIRHRIAAAETTNRNVELRKQRDAMIVELKAAQEKADGFTKAIEGRKAAAAKAVLEADLPVPGLELTDDAVLLNGQPFNQASDAEQLRVSVAVAGAMNPKLRVVRVRDGSLLDKESWAALEKYAEENDVQIWCETVESGRESAIVIENGMVASEGSAA